MGVCAFKSRQENIWKDEYQYGNSDYSEEDHSIFAEYYISGKKHSHCHIEVLYLLNELN